MQNLLIGKTIVTFKIADDKQALLFVTAEGESLIARVDADCCSYSWIESIELPALGLPFQIRTVDDLEMPKADEWDEEGYILTQFYGAKLTTDKGDLIIDFRNESNGYYGGNISWPGEGYFYGGVHGQNVSKETWVDVIDAG